MCPIVRLWESQSGLRGRGCRGARRDARPARSRAPCAAGSAPPPAQWTPALRPTPMTAIGGGRGRTRRCDCPRAQCPVRWARSA